ncbi:hypothetical protein [Corallococcus terminator]|uniref:Cyclic beta 1-2 glucan synthetase n=1 Tax=Corallococcus terminator TaxID=2316733 RepID=A0A3A8IZU3_9BACT|nr:hypothetical protein [Corallococcus terminator]RKG88705.1 hypothetical protein D7V88_13820 [Corallococcus terminator]
MSSPTTTNVRAASSAPPAGHDAEALQALDAVLEQEPEGAYGLLDDATRERYREACRELAAGSGRTLVEVAREAVRLSAEQPAGDGRARHVGTHLLAEGRPVLEARLGCRVSAWTRLSRGVRAHAETLYVLTPVVVLPLVLLLGDRVLAGYGIDLARRLGLEAVVALALLVFLQDRMTEVLSLLVGPLRSLPRLDPRRVFTPETRTMVVTPVLIGGAEQVDEQLRMLEINALGNLEPEVSFTLLTDFRDADQQHLPGEDALVRRLEEGIQALNARHAAGGPPRFFCLHRERRWNPVARLWMGWERKRGKLEEFNRLVRGATDTSYVSAVPEVVRTVRYVITLDADTHLLPGGAGVLVGTLHHPLNRARFDASGQRVVAGYSILQPAYEFAPTREMWLMNGRRSTSLLMDRKMKPHGEGYWGLLQRAYGTSDFHGKGIYDVEAFSRALEGRLPLDHILAHDLIEGMYSRVAYGHDIKIFEAEPGGHAVFARLLHRWARGSWQLLPWVFPRVPMRDGSRVPNTLKVFYRLRLAVDLLRNLGQPLSVATLVYGWWLLPELGAGWWTLWATLWACRDAVVEPVKRTLITVWRARSLGAGLGAVVRLVPVVVAMTLLSLCALLPMTAVYLDAISRALYGLLFDRSRMLEWTTYAQSNQRTKSWGALALPEVWGGLVMSPLFAALLAWRAPHALPWAAPFLLLWIPLVVVSLRAPTKRLGREVPPQEAERLRALARQAWEHYRQDGATEAAREFTPTDLALRLVAPLSAFHLGHLEPDGLEARTRQVLQLLEGLERHHGHFLSRYMDADRQPVSPRRILPEESGMLAAALVVVEGGLQAVRSRPLEAALEAGLKGLEAQAHALREAMHFAFLYDAEAGLFHTGYDVEAGRQEEGHHGALTSGALLAGFMAISNRQVPLKHWVTLAEAAQRGGAGTGASGTDLLPALFLWFPPKSLLAQAAEKRVAAEQGAERPLLELRFRPAEVLARLPDPAELRTSRHQATALAAVANAVCDDVLVKHFHQHWRTAWVEALVFETDGR